MHKSFWHWPQTAEPDRFDEERSDAGIAEGGLEHDETAEQRGQGAVREGEQRTPRAAQGATAGTPPAHRCGTTKSLAVDAE